MDKVTVMKDIDELHDMYCADCLVIKQLRKERGKQGQIVFVLRRVQ
ncbi:Zinc-finger domain-containing protein OS=Lysinibacillus sphaericus OX=1421 GN=LS41612_14440 PE=4 SV=1 [Lysinibacillus sphaericus]